MYRGRGSSHRGHGRFRLDKRNDEITNNNPLKWSRNGNIVKPTLPIKQPINKQNLKMTGHFKKFGCFFIFMGTDYFFSVCKCQKKYFMVLNTLQILFLITIEYLDFNYSYWDVFEILHSLICKTMVFVKALSQWKLIYSSINSNTI